MQKRGYMTKTSKKPAKKTAPKRASRKTSKAIKFFKGEAPASDLLEDTPIDKKRTPVPMRPTLNDRFFDWIEDKQTGKWFMLALTTAFIVVVAYWGIKQ